MNAWGLEDERIQKIERSRLVHMQINEQAQQSFEFNGRLGVTAVVLIFIA